MKTLLTLALLFSAQLFSEVESINFEETIEVCSEVIESESGGAGDKGYTVEFNLEDYFTCVSGAISKSNPEMPVPQMQQLVSSLLVDIFSRDNAYATINLHAGPVEYSVDSEYSIDAKGQIKLLNSDAYFGQGASVKISVQRVVSILLEL